MPTMNTFPPLDLVRRSVQEGFGRVRESRFFHDRFSMTLITLALTLNAGTFLWLVGTLRPTEVPVPVRYSNLLSGFDQTGPWYFPFAIATYALAVTALNAVFAYQSFNRSRLGSFFLLVASVVVAGFSFIIASAFGAVR